MFEIVDDVRQRTSTERSALSDYLNKYIRYSYSIDSRYPIESVNRM